MFAALAGPARDRFLAAGTVVNLAPGETLFQRGDRGDAAFVVLAGELEAVMTDEDGRSLRLAAFGVGAVAGELAVIDGEPRSAEVRATRKTRLLRLSRKTVQEALAADPQAALALVSELARRLRAADASLQLQTWGGLPQKLARLLLDEAGEGARVALTQTEMARRLGVARENVNRRLHAWRDAGVVTLSKSGVALRDRDGLTAIAHGRKGADSTP